MTYELILSSNSINGKRDDPRPSPALSCYKGTGLDGVRGSGTKLLFAVLTNLGKCCKSVMSVVL